MASFIAYFNRLPSEARFKMKTSYLLIAFTALAGTAFAQLDPLPPSSTLDGVTIHSIGLNAGATHWDSLLSLGAYRFTSDLYLASPKPGTPDNVLGLTWTSSCPPQALAGRTRINSLAASEGGAIRAIFLGESAAWLNDFGYTYSGKPQANASSYTVFSDIQSMSGTPYSVNVEFGQYVDVPIAKDSALNFDFWLNGVGANGVVTPSSTLYGGVYTAFDAANSDPLNSPGNVMWSEPFLVSTYYASIQGYADTETYLVSFEDWRTDKNSDDDYNDYMFAVQFITSAPPPFPIPVPEPSTYGMFGVAALLGLVFLRRFNSR